MKRIADYELVEQLGQGNHGTFYRARTPPRLGVDEEFCAVKVLDQRAGDDEFRRMANELTLFASARSPYLVTLFDAGHQGGILFYAVRYHPAGSLARPASDLSTAERVRAVADAARGAHDLHEVGVAHRDIKPANILLTDLRTEVDPTPDGSAEHAAPVAVLADLGLAQLLNPGATMTGTGPIGSIEFMEPGLVRGERAGRASDIWSLGVALHWALTGRGVFGRLPEQDLLAALRHVLAEEPRVGSELGGEVSAVIASCLAPERADRPSTAADLADRLDRIATERARA